MWKRHYTSMGVWFMKTAFFGTFVVWLFGQPQPQTLQAAQTLVLLQVIGFIMVAFLMAFTEVNKLIKYYLDQEAAVKRVDE